jgi:hypothetical protein
MIITGLASLALLAAGGSVAQASSMAVADTTGPSIVMQDTGHLLPHSPVTCRPGDCRFDTPPSQVFETTAQVRWKVSDPSGVCDNQVWNDTAHGGDWPFLEADVGKATSYDIPTGDLDDINGGYNYTSIEIRSEDCVGNWSVSGYDRCSNPCTDPTYPFPATDRYLDLPDNYNTVHSHDDNTATYSGRGAWTHSTGTAFMGGSDIHAVKAGASMTYTYDSQVFAWVSEYGPGRGSAKVYQDGILKATVSLYAKANTGPEVVWSNWFTAIGPHTIKVVVVGTAGHPRVDVDGFFTGPLS